MIALALFLHKVLALIVYFYTTIVGVLVKVISKKKYFCRQMCCTMVRVLQVFAARKHFNQVTLSLIQHLNTDLCFVIALLFISAFYLIVLESYRKKIGKVILLWAWARYLAAHFYCFCCCCVASLFDCFMFFFTTLSQYVSMASSRRFG